MSRPENDQSYFARPHVLVVDDDERIRDLVSRYLLDHGFVVVSAADAAEARHLLGVSDIDIAVVDVMMPGESGLDLTAALRDKYPDLPVVLLTALGELDDRVAGFESGADDYLAKPFEPQELVLRMKALLRRSMVKPQEDRVLAIGAFVFDMGAGILNDETGVSVSLTDAERVLLTTLASKSGQVLSREALAKACGIAGARAVDVQVTRLRRKIEVDTRNPVYLQTVRGQGYLLRSQDVED